LQLNTGHGRLSEASDQQHWAGRMDKRIRRNEVCIIGLPRCDFVFSSTRSAFIGYGFAESTLEMNILRHLLTAKGIEPVEAAGALAPGQNAFCVKICSKVITSQFCIILLNNDVKSGQEIPNANVNMEYGLMLGFNKYVIPFQRGEQKLPFNVAGLDTIKYTQADFEKKASVAIDVAVEATAQEVVAPIRPDQVLEAFLMSMQVLIAPLTSPGERNIFGLGRPLGYNLVTHFDGVLYRYFGNFTALRADAVLWRIRTLQDVVSARVGSMPARMEMWKAMPGFNQQQFENFKTLVDMFEVWVLVTSNDDKATIQAAAEQAAFRWPVKVFALSDIETALKSIA
jgi:hypothetical protein